METRNDAARAVIRPARDGDLDRLVEIHTSAFPDPRGHHERVRNFVGNPLGDLADLLVLEEDGVIVAHAFAFPLVFGFGGVHVPGTGIASVAVATDARGRGHATRLLEHVHAEARARGHAVTLLYAFRQGFYAGHGYAAVTPMRRLRFRPGALPDAWRSEARLRTRAARGEDRAAIVRAFEREVLRRTGLFVRKERDWDGRFSDERRRWFVVEGDGEVLGFLAWTVAQREPHATTTLRIHDLAADSSAARRALLGLVAAQRDQVDRVLFSTTPDDPLALALEDAEERGTGTEEVEHPLGELAAGPLVRIVDVPRALTARGYLADGTLTLDVEGDRLALAVANGRARHARGQSGSALRLDRAALAAILYGGVRPSDAAQLGRVDVLPEPEAGPLLASADRLLHLPHFLAADPF